MLCNKLSNLGKLFCLFGDPTVGDSFIIKVSPDITGSLFDLQEEETKSERQLTLTIHPSVLEDKLALD